MKTSEQLQSQPLWEGDSLGKALPDSQHAVSMSLPRWQDVVGYEEKRPEVVDRLACGYPRFVIHPLVREVVQRVGGGRPGLPFPSAAVAAQAAAFVRKTGAVAEVVADGGLHCVFTTEPGFAELKAFWQHTGLIVSSRQAAAWLASGMQPRAGGAESRQALRRLLAEFYDCGEGDVFLAPTGMAAQYAALRAVVARSPGRRTAQLGFPYVDTLKLQQKMGNGGVLLHDLERLPADLESLLAREPLAACFGEIPGNPLLGSANLLQVTPLLKRHGVPFVADDVVATPFNVDLSGHAALIATSLTKYIVGTAEAMGGAVICNPRSPYYAALRESLAAQHEELLWDEDVAVLLENGRGFPQRMIRHNEGGLYIAERLREHPAVERVWYPKWEFTEVYESVRRPGGGWGALVTFLPKRAAETSPGIYDRLQICKGPSLGTVFSLACPFTLLAHYTELEWAEACGVSRHLIRLSVGLEEPGELWARIDQALNGVGSTGRLGEPQINTD